MPAGSLAAPRQPDGVGLGPARALTVRACTDARILTVVFCYLFAVYSFVQPVGFRRAYPTMASREPFARSFGANKGLRLLYGQPHDLLTVTGYCAWRVGGVLAIAAAAYGLLATVRALRADEEAGRTELVLAGLISRRTAYLSALVAIGIGAVILWLAEFAGFLVGGLPAAGSAYLALATASVVPVFAGLAAVASQLAPTRRLALELSGAAAALFFLLRVVADTSGAGWLRWLTPLGWAEELRPFASPEPVVLLLPAAASVLLLVLAGRLAAVRDVGSGLIAVRGSARPRLRLLSSPTAQALRSQRDSLVAWAGCFAVFAFILGVVSGSVSSAGISKGIEREIARLGSGSILTPSGYMGFIFLFVIVAVCLFGCAQVGAARREEADQQLETLLALPVSRTGWLTGRLLIAVAAAAGISLLAGLLAWAGAASGGASVSLGRMLEAGANCLPVTVLFLGVSVLAYAVVPRASAAAGYGLVTVAFLWQTVAALLGAPRWLVDITPFAHVGLVPAEPFQTVPAVIMIGIGLAACLAGLGVFRRRDLLAG